jgi:hypothetical protein
LVWGEGFSVPGQRSGVAKNQERGAAGGRMAKQDFIPDSDADMLVWHANFKTQVAAVAGTFGLSSDEVAAIAANDAALTADVNEAETARNVAQQKSQSKRATRNRVEGEARSLARRFKTHPAYSESLGAQLGIEGPEDSADLSQEQPTLQAQVGPGAQVTISCNKSVSDGVNIYSRRSGESGFAFLARDTNSPYVDARPKASNAPETREYQAVYVLRDEEIGQPSAVVSVTLP